MKLNLKSILKRMDNFNNYMFDNGYDDKFPTIKFYGDLSGCINYGDIEIFEFDSVKDLNTFFEINFATLKNIYYKGIQDE